MTLRSLVGRSALAAVALGAGLLVGCASLFGPDRPSPKELEPIAVPTDVPQVWRESIGDVSFPLTVAVNQGVLTLAASSGSVVGLEASSGRVVWRANVGAPIAAGVGNDGKLAAVVTTAGELVAIEAGAVKWRSLVGGRVATAPLVAGGRVFIVGVDRAVQAFDGEDGSKLWQVQRPGDPLALSQSGVIAAFRNTLVVGQGPRLAGLDPANGSVRWEVPIGSPRGANEIERLADLVGPAVRVGVVLCARSFQAAVGCVDAERGTTLWTKTIGGTDAIGGDRELLFAADAADRLTAWRTPSGEVAWTSESLMYRGLGAPAAAGNSVAFGDRDGTLHWFSRAKGESQARTPTDGSAVAVPPVVVDGTVVFVTRKGGVFAFRPS